MRFNESFNKYTEKQQILSFWIRTSLDVSPTIIRRDLTAEKEGILSRFRGIKKNNGIIEQSMSKKNLNIRAKRKLEK